VKITKSVGLIVIGLLVREAYVGITSADLVFLLVNNVFLVRFTSPVYPDCRGLNPLFGNEIRRSTMSWHNDQIYYVTFTVIVTERSGGPLSGVAIMVTV
jgi:hypothetical protein